jgi:hypothetical protein
MYGNPVEFDEMRTMSANTLMGSRINVPVAGVLSHFGLIAKGGAGNVVMALYTDSTSGPRNLVALTPVTAIPGAGRHEVTMPRVSIAAGNYWLMAVYDVAGVEIGMSRSVPSAVVRFSPVGFSPTLPNPIGFSQTFSGQRYSYYVRMLP